LNKIDLFAEKLLRSPLGDCFPDFDGGNNYGAACDYLLHRFVSLNQSERSYEVDICPLYLRNGHAADQV
jgi:guanine nucleotide-binding protein subunit alpha